MVELSNGRVTVTVMGHEAQYEDDDVELMREAIRELTREVMRRERANSGNRSSW